ncbi:oxidative stress-induced growth inhibitor 1-like [Hylaeus volcanicus]|uniref:oxidative stress-induced growth inhibitor 1-like n=1 Tax=Hylaeus volcanicus TaxID=313075 RepID=UPI0023B7CABE|nr:oxidative stress-induced growth inhibitor 1-like [Hylaeus volcanicus]XP_053980733.1 oxidative stress-induced growth inhibitor 1-like [Hylaeus volcanicus]
MQNCYDDDDRNVVYKDVVIIGNGPSGICLSYMLAGNWPYYTGEPHPGDEMLTARLHFSTRPEECSPASMDDETRNGTSNRWQQSKSDRCESRSQGRGLARSTRCKLEHLSSGIEGRVGGRPLALLMDQLQHPCVDAGLDVPSLLTWKSVDQHPEHKVIDHVVLGKGQPGGAWQTMDPNVLTISLNRWMSLPDLEIRQWEKMVESELLRTTNSTEGGPCAFQERLNASKTTSRISVGTVAAYYKDYVRRKGLEQFFRCGTTVTSVRPARVSNADETDNRYGWLVEGFENKTGKVFRYRCKRAVLATGTTDLSNQLGILGEDSHPEWVTHDLNDLESRLDRLVDQYHDEELADRVEPVLIIGAGLSAADAIIAARFRGIPVLHAFRDPSSEWSKSKDERIYHTKFDRLQGLPSSMYPEYHKVYEMMADGGTNYPLYRALQGYSLIGFDGNGGDSMDVDESQSRVVTLLAPDGQLRVFRVSVVAILIGYKPDLSYLEGNGIGLGRLPDKPIDRKLNPIDVDNFTYEVVKAPRPGLYALGPLVGDNFVRYILGGAFGILAHILNTSSS